LGLGTAPLGSVEAEHAEIDGATGTGKVADAPSSIPAFAGEKLNGSASGTILLVEDEAFVRDVVDEILSSAGYHVLKARSAGEALRIFHCYQGKIELLLTDVVLPDRNGCDLALEFALLCRGVRTIFISGYAENALTRKGFVQERWLYLPKPFSGQTLIHKVTEALQNCSV
jgi:DNA-binding NtrC family response regulator